MVVYADLLHDAAETLEALRQMNPGAHHLRLGDETSAFPARLFVIEALVFRKTHENHPLARCAACKTKSPAASAALTNDVGKNIEMRVSRFALVNKQT